MKVTTSLIVALIASGVSWAQSDMSGSISGPNWRLTIAFESRLEPPKPQVMSFGMSGVTTLDKSQPGMRRYTATTETHEYFGYDMKLEPVDRQTGTFRVTFSALTLTPEDLKLPDPGSWHMIPAPLFPPPQIVSTADTIAVDLFEDPATLQKVVDYVHFRRNNCDAENAGSDQIACLDGVVRDARRSLGQKIKDMESKRDSATVSGIKESQRIWEAYRSAACANLSTELKSLQCELKLTRSRIHDLDVMY
ncbi:MAG: DUF1311 domain-containing protein [Acidobacteriota bacterium]|nr:DUF1311 domain-containing protein [Acidobacteriota bacterium]